MRDVERDQPPAGAQHAQHLLEAGGQVDQIAQHEGAGDDIEGGVGEGQAQRVGLEPVGRVRAELGAGALKHLGGEVGSDDGGRAAGAELLREIAGARAQIEHLRALRLRGLHRLPPPAAVETGRHHPIHAVVLRRQAAEHRLDGSGALLAVLLAVPLAVFWIGWFAVGGHGC